MNIKTFSCFITLLSIYSCSVFDMPKETADSNQVATGDMITSVVKNMTEDHVYITVTMISSELWSRELGLGDSTEHYYPNIVLNGGEYLEISYNGQRRRFTNGAESPFETNYILSTNSLDEFSVRFYRNSGDTIEMAAASGGPPDFSITPVGFIDIDYYRSIPITWSNARPGTNMNVSLEADCSVASTTFKYYSTGSSSH